MPDLAFDAAGHPDPQACADAGGLFVGQYVGTKFQAYGVTKPYIDACHAAGIGVLLIFEEGPNQFLGGAEAAEGACGRMMAGWDALGAPRDGTVFPAVALLDPSPSALNGHEVEFQAWAKAWNDTLPFDQFTGYGSRAALELAAEVAPKMTRRWGVGTWGYGEQPDGGLPDPVGADMIQHGNLGSPVPGTDRNTVFRPDMGQWGTSPAPTPVPRALETDVELLVKNTDNGDWFHFPPFCAPAVKVTPEYVLALAGAGVPHGETNGPTIVQLDADRKALRASFVSECRGSDESGKVIGALKAMWPGRAARVV